MSIERIVRPFQSGDPFRARTIPPSQPPLEPAAPPPTLSWAGRNDGAYVEAPSPGNTGFTAEWKEDPSRRVTEKVRVENPDDSTQYVEVERIKKAVFKNDKTGEELKLAPNWG